MVYLSVFLIGGQSCKGTRTNNKLPWKALMHQLSFYLPIKCDENCITIIKCLSTYLFKCTRIHNIQQCSWDLCYSWHTTLVHNGSSPAKSTDPLPHSLPWKAKPCSVSFWLSQKHSEFLIVWIALRSRSAGKNVFQLRKNIHTWDI